MLLLALAIDPDGQSWQAEDPINENFPVVHGSQYDDPLVSLFFPAGQAEHCPDPANKTKPLKLGQS